MNNKQKIESLRQSFISGLETYSIILNKRPDFPNRVRYLFDTRNEMAHEATLLHNAEIITDEEYFTALKIIEKYT